MQHLTNSSLFTSYCDSMSSPSTCCIISNVSAVVLPNFWQNFIFAHCSNCDISSSDMRIQNTITTKTVLLLKYIHTTVSCWDKRLIDVVLYHSATYALKCTTVTFCSVSEFNDCTMYVIPSCVQKWSIN